MSCARKAVKRPIGRCGKPYVLQVRTSNKLLVDALRALSARNRRSLNNELLVALERHLTAEGAWAG